MTLKLKINGKKEIPINRIYKGVEAFNIPYATVCKVTYRSVSNHGDIIVRTNDDKTPFITLRTNSVDDTYKIGSTWGDAISDYEFETMPDYAPEDFDVYRDSSQHLGFAPVST